MKSSDASIHRAMLFIVVSALSFGSISVLTVLTTRAGVGLLTAMAWRYVFGAILLGAFVSARDIKSIPRQRVLQLLMIGGCGQALITYVSLRALDYIPVGQLAFLFYTYPAWVAILAALRGAENLTLVRIVALVLALAGVSVMIGMPTKRLNPMGVTLALGSALLYSGYLPALEHVQNGLPARSATFLLTVGAAIAFVLSALLTGQLSLTAGTAVWMSVLLLAFVSTAIAFSALIKGLAVLGPVRTSIIATIEPFFTAILGVVVLQNEINAATWIGGILIAAAILVIAWNSTDALVTVQRSSVSVDRLR